MFCLTPDISNCACPVGREWLRLRAVRTALMVSGGPRRSGRWFVGQGQNNIPLVLTSFSPPLSYTDFGLSIFRRTRSFSLTHVLPLMEEIFALFSPSHFATVE
jgi:hypothetical protein